MSPQTTSPRIAAVIPFYQRTEDLLARAVRSALGQTGVDGLEIIVVDDGSPVPAQRELDGVVPSSPHLIRIVERPNGGPGAARNTGLDHVPAGVDYVAFLDSDDEWLFSHLASAMEAPERIHNCYLSDVHNAEARDGTLRNKGAIVEPVCNGSRSADGIGFATRSTASSIQSCRAD